MICSKVEKLVKGFNIVFFIEESYFCGGSTSVVYGVEEGLRGAIDSRRA